jgi:hypothetical protein
MLTFESTIFFSKEISGFAALKRTIREVERGPVHEHGNKSQKRSHKKKKRCNGVSQKTTKWLDRIPLMRT